ncbi:MAG TPA: rhamnulokinase family protein [Candidatus Limiplasma sp.]|nr:rhamnulokinase family protein [Candidatus Limiplasma sp.]
MPSYLAIDIGASSGRHILGQMRDGVLQTEEIYRFDNRMLEKNGHLCWDAENLHAQVIAGLKECARRGERPVTVGIDTWAVDFVLLDQALAPLGDLVAYRDARTHGMDALLEQTFPAESLYRRTGIAKQPFNTLYQLMAVFREHPEYRERAQHLLFVPEYLSFLLTGRMANEYTNASTSALLNAETAHWDSAVYGAANLPPALFARQPVPAGTPLGPFSAGVAKELGFTSTVLLPATHDTGSAFMAVPARDANAVFLSSGTWSLLGTELPRPLCDEASRAAGFTNEGGYGGAIRYLKNIMGLWMLQRIRAELNGAYRFEQMAQMAAESAYPACIDAADPRFLAPENMTAEVHAALREQGEPAPQSLGDTFRAVTLGLARCYQRSVTQLENLTGKRFTSINIVGGGSQNQVLNQMTADCTGLPVFAGPAEGTAIGNLAAQMIAAGELSGLAEARQAIRRSFSVQTFLPQPPRG